MVKKLEKLLRKQLKDIPRPFGIFLSGGMDSGILAALSKPNFAVTCNFPLGKKYDELEHTTAVAKKLGIPLKVIQPEQKDFKVQLRKAVKIIGKPINSVSIVPWYNLMKETSGKTMIGGEGADELFGGYSRYIILHQIFKLYKAPQLQNYRPTLDFLFGGAHAKLVETNVPETEDIEELMRVEYDCTLPNILLMEDRLAEHFNVNLVRPFINPDIKEFADLLPLEKKINGFTTKIILRKLARKYLPRSIADRVDKKGLICPVNKWMGWTGERGEFDKIEYINFQQRCLN